MKIQFRTERFPEVTVVWGRSGPGKTWRICRIWTSRIIPEWKWLYIDNENLKELKPIL